MNFTLEPVEEETIGSDPLKKFTLEDAPAQPSFTLSPPFKENPFKNPTQDRSPLDPLMRYDPEQVLTKEEILGDKELFNLYVREPMEARFGEGGRNRWLLDQDYDQEASDE